MTNRKFFIISELGIKCIIGLGNPGKRYAETRHNIGFMVLDEIAGRHKAGFITGGVSFLSTGASRSFQALLLKPTTYMNLSGRAVAEVMAKKGFFADELLIVYDDLDLPFGKLRLRKSGSAGGHNGLEDILDILGTNDIARIRVGIGPRPVDTDGADFVLSKFDETEQASLPDMIKRAADAAELALVRGFTVAMNEFNKKD